MAYKAFNGKNEKEAYIPSLSLELLHNSTLIHDDFMDEDELRRNEPTVYKKIKGYFLKNFKYALFSNFSLSGLLREASKCSYETLLSIPTLNPFCLALKQ